jgi:hypothetical protein
MNEKEILEAAHVGKTLYVGPDNGDWYAVKILKYNTTINGPKKWKVQFVDSGKINYTRTTAIFDFPVILPLLRPLS